jgi:hypothetical protein
MARYQDPIKHREQQRRYVAQNYDKIRERANSPECLLRKKESRRQYTLLNAEKCAERRLLYREAHAE